MNQNYYIGLDCGTNSVGWAVTDEKYNLIKKAGKTLWGTRLFEEAVTAQKRRMARSARRRNGRKSQRIALLREIFTEEVAKTDAGFYARMDESQFWQQDKYCKTKYALFASDGFTDWDYYKKYPTIYHLREALAQGQTPADVRLLFLGINHIMKHRGHFLFAGQDFTYIPDFKQVWLGAQASLQDALSLSIDCSSMERLEEIVSMKASVTHKKNMLKELFICDDKFEEQKKVIIALLAGGKIDIKALLFSEDSEETLPKVSFADDTFENEEICDILEKSYADLYVMLLQLKAVYDYGILANIMSGHSYYSQAKVASYNKHKQDLKKLKDVIKMYAPQEYAKMFRSVSDKTANYSSYIGYCKVAGKKNKDLKLCKPEDFFKAVKKIIEKIDCEDARTILQDIDAGTFLPKQTTKENSVVPNQVHLHELKAILQNNLDKFPFLSVVDAEGFTAAKKIELLLTFRIPYYVGPLNDTHKQSGFCWVVKKRQGSITPWNFDSIVDKEASAKKFIENLTATCTYLTGQTVLPKNSILYSRYMVLNELNNLKLHGEPITVELKQEIFESLFLEKKKVTGKALQQWFENRGILGKGEKDVITGIDGDFASSRSVEIEMNKIFGAELPPVSIQEQCIQAILCLANEP